MQEGIFYLFIYLYFIYLLLGMFIYFCNRALERLYNHGIHNRNRD